MLYICIKSDIWIVYPCNSRIHELSYSAMLKSKPVFLSFKYDCCMNDIYLSPSVFRNNFVLINNIQEMHGYNNAQSSD